ncbi:hypothetical protein BJX96DRAFT_19964 [Aspergillus floccosus]
MDGIEVVHPQQRARVDDPGIRVAPHSEKQVCPNDNPIYVSGPDRPNGEDGEDLKRRNKAICGLKPTVFWTLFVIALLVVIGAAVGGGVGGTLANRRTSEPSLTASSSSSTTSEAATTNTASTTSSAPVTSGTMGIAANPCPGKNLTTVTGSDGSIFTLLCAVDWPRGGPASSGNGTVEDLTRTTRYTLQSCIADCVNWNKDRSNDSACKGIIYTANLTAAYDGGQDGNCFLKNTVGVYYPNSNASMAAGMLGG